MKKEILIGLLLGFFICVGIAIYFVAGVSTTYPPIRKYEFSGNINQFINEIDKNGRIDSSLKITVVDTVGNAQNSNAIYFDIELKTSKDDILYGIKCEENTSNNLNNTLINLVEAYDKKLNTGGYSKEAKDVGQLLDKFELIVLKPLIDDRKLKIIE